MSSYLERTKTVLGEETIRKIQKAKILVIGLGGVGGTALNALYRSGFNNFTLIDSDEVDETNLNRQVMYDTQDVGKLKTEICKTKMLSFNPNFVVNTINLYLDRENISAIFTEKYDFVIDAIDFVPAKIALYKYCLDNNIPFISSLGMAKRINPEDVLITNLNKTENDPLAKKIRYEARQLGLDCKKIPVVFSKENPIDTGKELGSMMFVPSTAGLLIAKFVITNLQ